MFLVKAFFVGCIPVIGLGHINAFLLADHHERPEFVDFDHLRCIRQTLKPNLVQIVRIRTKKFPWGDGDKSLFHNKKLNALPDGYETFGGINSSLWFCPCPCPCPGPLVCPCPCPHIEPCPLLCCVHSKSWTALGTLLHFPRANFIIQKIN